MSFVKANMFLEAIRNPGVLAYCSKKPKIDKVAQYPWILNQVQDDGTGLIPRMKHEAEKGFSI